MTRLPFDRWDACAALGGLLVALGAWMIYHPAGVALVGFLLIRVGLLGAAHSERAP